MKPIRIFYSDTLDTNAEHMAFESEPLEIDLKALNHFYASQGEKHARALEKFNEFWRTEESVALFAPRAVITKMSFEQAMDNFAIETLNVNKSTDTVVMALWTIGGALEQKASQLMETRGSLMTGFLLDVAGSIALYDMHRVLISWVDSNISAPCGKFLNGEFYPGIGSMKQDLMERVVSASSAERLIGVAAACSSLLKPRKAQCSFLVLGTEDQKFTIRNEPCKPCSGKKCLYYQLGGCHLTSLQF